MRISKKLFPILICLAIILSSALSVTPTFAADGDPFGSSNAPSFTAVILDSQGNTVASDCDLQYSIVEGNGGSTYQYWIDGKLAFFDLPDGKYLFRAVAAGSLLSEDNAASMPQSVQVENGQVTFVNDQAYTGEDLSFTLLPAQLTVNLSGASGEPVPGINVWIHEILPDYPRYQFSVVTNGDGTAYIGGMEPGKQYCLSANPTFESGYVSSDNYTVSIDGNGAYSGQNPLSVSLLQPQFQANVLNPDLSPSDGVQLLLYDGNNRGIPLEHTSFSNMNMQKIGGLADGNYTIKAVSYNSAYTASRTYPFTIENGAVTMWSNETVQGDPVFDIPLTCLQVSGTVAYEGLDGNYYTYLDVYEVNESGLNWAFNIYSNDGTFSMGGLEPNKTYALVAYPSLPGYTQSEPVYITVDGLSNANPGDIAITLRKPTAQVRGTVTDKDGNPASGYTVYAWTPTGNYGSGSDNSNYEMYDLPDGDYRVRAIPGTTDNAPSKARHITIEGGVLTSIDGVPCSPDAALDLQLSKVTLTGTVREKDGAPVANAWVAVLEAGANEIEYNVCSDENGSFSLGGFEPDKQYLIFANNYPTLMSGEPATISTDSQGIPTTGNMTILVYRPQIYANITDPNGNPVTDWCNFSVTGDSYTSYSCFIEGKLASWGIGDGTYVIRAVPQGPLVESGLAPSLPIRVQIENGVLKTINGQPANSNIIDMALTNPQFSVNVTDENGIPLRNAIVTVSDEGQLDKPASLAIFPDNNGVAGIGGLEAGKNYIVMAYPTDQAPYFVSDQYPITIDAEGNYTGISPLTIVLHKISNDKKILAFAFENPSVSGVVNDDAKTIMVSVPYGTDVKNLVPAITVSDFAFTSPYSGTPQDFTSPVVYTVTAQDGSAQDYTVTVTVEPCPIRIDKKNRIVTVPVEAACDGHSALAAAAVNSGVVNETLGIINAFERGKPVDLTFAVTGVADASGIRVAIPAASFRDIADCRKTGSLTIKSEIGSITFDKKDLDRLERKMGANDAFVYISISKADVNQYLAPLPKILRNKMEKLIGNRPVYDFDIMIDNSIIPFSMLQDPVVTVPYVLGPNERQKDVVVLYLNNLGLLRVHKDCKYDKTSQTVTFKLD